MVLWRVADVVQCCAGAKTTFGQYGGWSIKLLWFGSAVDFHINIWTQIAPEFLSAFNQFAPQSCEAGPALLVCIPVNIRVNIYIIYNLYHCSMRCWTFAEVKLTTLSWQCVTVIDPEQFFTSVYVLPNLFYRLKQYLAAFEYRQGSETTFIANKLRPLSRIMATARMVYNLHNYNLFCSQISLWMLKLHMHPPNFKKRKMKKLSLL